MERLASAASQAQISLADEKRGSQVFLENREQRLMGDKNKLEMSAFLQSKRFMEQSEKIFDQEMKNVASTGEQVRLGSAGYSTKSVDQSELMEENDPLA